MMSFFIAMFFSVYPMEFVEDGFNRTGASRITVPQPGTAGKPCQCG